MKHLFAVILFVAPVTALSAAEPEWSEPVNGIRARLSLERQKDSPFLKVFIEFQNTSDTAGIKKLRFTPGTILAQVVDENGEPLKTPTGFSYDGLSPTWEPLGLPFEGTLRFRISFPGMGYRPDQDHTILDFGPDACWAVPDDQNYFLASKLTIPKQEGDHPHSDWHGTLILPKVPVPKPNTQINSKASVLQKILPTKEDGSLLRPQTLEHLVCSIWFADASGDPLPEFRMRIENTGSEEVVFQNTMSMAQIELVSDTGERVRLPGPDRDRIRTNRRGGMGEAPVWPIEVIGLEGSDGEDSAEGNPIPAFSPVRIRPGESANFLLRYFPNAQRRFETQPRGGFPFDLELWRIEVILRLSWPDLDEKIIYHSYTPWSRAK